MSEDIKKKISLYLDGQLDEAEVSEIERLIETESEYKKYYDDLLKLSEMADQFDITGEEDYWEDQKEKVLSRIDQSEKMGIEPIRPRKNRWFYKAITAAAILALVGYVSFQEWMNLGPDKRIVSPPVESQVQKDVEITAGQGAGEEQLGAVSKQAEPVEKQSYAKGKKAEIAQPDITDKLAEKPEPSDGKAQDAGTGEEHMPEPKPQLAPEVEISEAPDEIIEAKEKRSLGVKEETFIRDDENIPVREIPAPETETRALTEKIDTESITDTALRDILAKDEVMFDSHKILESEAYSAMNQMQARRYEALTDSLNGYIAAYPRLFVDFDAQAEKRTKMQAGLNAKRSQPPTAPDELGITENELRKVAEVVYEIAKATPDKDEKTQMAEYLSLFRNYASNDLSVQIDKYLSELKSR